MILPQPVSVNDPSTGAFTTMSVCPVCGVATFAIPDWRKHSDFHERHLA